MNTRPTQRICQLTSRHCIDDERILHRIAWTAKIQGFASDVCGPRSQQNHFTYNGIALRGVIRSAKRFKLLDYVWRPWQLFRHAMRDRDCVYVIHDPDMVLVAVLLRLLSHNVIYDVHDDYEASFKDRLQGRRWLRIWFPSFWWWFERNAARLMNGVIVADRHLAKKFERCAPIVLGNYPRMDFMPVADSGKESTFNLIYVGGVTEERGLGKALEALQKIPTPELRLHIIGTGRDENLMSRLRAEHRVVLHGRVEWTKLHEYYTQAHVGLALYQPLAGFVTVDHSVKIVEYMAAGIPTICSNFPGLNAFVQDQGCGLTVKPDDPEAIAAAICRLMDDSELRKRLGAKGRELFETEYNWEKHEHRLVELYERVCGGAS